MLTKDQIDRFQMLFKKRFGRDLSKEEALESATKLIQLMALIYKPMTKKDFQRFSHKQTINKNK